MTVKLPSVMVVEFAWAVAIASASTDTTAPAMSNESAVGTSRPENAFELLAMLTVIETVVAIWISLSSPWFAEAGAITAPNKFRKVIPCAAPVVNFPQPGQSAACGAVMDGVHVYAVGATALPR